MKRKGGGKVLKGKRGLERLVIELGKGDIVEGKRILHEDLGLPFTTMKNWLYYGTKPSEENIKRLITYFENKLKRKVSREYLLGAEKPKLKGKPKPQKKLPSKLTETAKRLKNLAGELGGGNETIGKKRLMQDLNIPEATINEWYYRGSIPSLKNLKRLSDYFTDKLGRVITPEYIRGEEEKEVKEVKKMPERKREETEKLVEKIEEIPVEKEIKGVDEIISSLENVIANIKELKVGEELSDEEKELILKFRKFSPSEKKSLLMVLK